MCRSIHPLFNTRPPATPHDLVDASRQFVRKVSGFREPSLANRPAFDRAVHEVTKAVATLMEGLVTNAPPRDLEAMAARARARRTARP